MIEIKNMGGRVIKTVEAINLRYADLNHVDLRYADLNHVDLRYANLGYANLCDANLCYADLNHVDLRYADLRNANLCDANLCYANLYGANLRYANLGSADLGYANLRDAKINWSSHELIAEILRQAADEDYKLRMIAGLILVSEDWCWKDFLKIATKAQKRWVMSVLTAYDVEDNPIPMRYKELFNA